MIAASGFFLEIFFKAKTGITISEYSKQAEKIVDDSMKRILPQIKLPIFILMMGRGLQNYQKESLLLI